MKSRLIAWLTIPFMVVSVYSQSQWVWQNPLPQGNGLNDVFTVDANTAFAVGFGGAFVKTTDAGASWNAIAIVAGSFPERVTRTLRAVHFADRQNGCVVGDNNTFLKTTDGGISWTAFEIPFVFDPMNPFKMPDTYSMVSVHFLDGQTGWAAGHKQVLENMTIKTVGAAMKTTDGGASWKDCSPQTGYWLHAVFFTDTQTGYAAGGTYNAALVLKTTDGGGTWTPCPNMPAYQSQSIELNALHFTDAQTGWAVGGMDLSIKTTDGGNTWEKGDWSALQYYLQPTDVFFSSAQTGWIIGSAILKTTNGGGTWVEQQAENIGKAVHFSGNDNGWMAGDAGLLGHTSDGGRAWVVQSRAASSSTIHALHFLQPSLGWAAGSYGFVLKTLDGGSRWQVLSVGDETDFLSVHFVDAATGWLAGAGYLGGVWTGQVYRTTNGGDGWEAKYAAPGRTVTDIFFIDSQTGWITGESGLLRKSTDGGMSWIDQANPHTGTVNRLESVHFEDENNGWVAAGHNGRIFNTTNGGASWTEQASGTTEWLYSVHFIDASTGWIAGGSAMLKTTDGGAAWVKQTLPSSVTHLQAVHFYDASNGIAAGTTGDVVRTTDGGATWTLEESGFSGQFNAVWSAGADLGWIAGENGAILRSGQVSANLPPSFVSAALVEVGEKTAFLYTAHAADPEGAKVTYVFSGYPAWMTPGDSTLSGTAPAGEGSASFTVTASDGANTAVLNVSVSITKGTGVARSAAAAPDRFSLSKAYPNPFNPSTTIPFGLPERADIVLRIFDANGKRVKDLFLGAMEAGQYRILWDGTDDANHAVSSGVYLYSMSAGSFNSVQKMLLIR